MNEPNQGVFNPPLPAECDYVNNDITYVEDMESDRYVKVIAPYVGASMLSPREEEQRRIFMAWQDKYGMPPPAEDQLDYWSPETSVATRVPYDGPSPLTEDEWAWVKECCNRGDFTMTDLWFIVEGLGWRPGRPVSLNDPKWDYVWLGEEECIGFVDVVMDALGMPLMDWDHPLRAAKRKEFKGAKNPRWTQMYPCWGQLHHDSV